MSQRMQERLQIGPQSFQLLHVRYFPVQLRDAPFLDAEKIDQQERSKPILVAPGQQTSASLQIPDGRLRLLRRDRLLQFSFNLFCHVSHTIAHVGKYL